MARVTLIVNNFDEGSETFLHALARQLVEIGHRVTVHVLLDDRTVMLTGTTFDPTTVGRSSALPAVGRPRFVLELTKMIVRSFPASLAAVLRAFRRYGLTRRGAHAALVVAPILATQPDVVHVALSGIGVAIDDALRILDRGTKLVVSCRGSGELVAPVLNPDLVPRLSLMLKRATAVHVVAGVIGEVVGNLGVDSNRIHLIRPAVDLERFRSLPGSSVSTDLFRVVTVARLHWVKGFDVQLEAAIKLASAGVALRWSVIGDGPARVEILVRAQMVGLDSVMEFLGPMPPDEVRRRVEAADVLVSSSWSEGTSNSVLEAMACGTPVVSTSVGGMPEVLTDQVDALVVPVGDANSLVGALYRLAEDPPFATRLAEGARQTVAERHCIRRQRDEWADLYDGLFAGSREVG